MTHEFAIVGSAPAACARLAAYFGISRIEQGAASAPADTAALDPKLQARELRERLENALVGSRGPLIAVYSTPWHYLHHAMNHGAETYRDLVADGMRILASWKAYHAALLSFCRQQPAKAVLINGDKPVDINALSRAIATQFGVPHNAHGNGDERDESTASASVGGALIGIVEAIAPDCIDLYYELEACAELLGREPEFSVDGFLQRREAVLEILALLAERTRLRRAMDRLQGEVETTQTAFGDSERARIAAQALAEERLQHIDELRRETTAAHNRNAQLEQEIRASNFETEALLKQLHETQERLEQQYSQNALLDDRLQRLSVSYDASVRGGATLEAQLKTAQAEREAMREKLGAGQSRIATLESRVHAEEGEREGYRTQLEDYRSQLERIQGELGGRVDSAQREAERYLLQLQQVQEELEHYFELCQTQSSAIERIKQERERSLLWRIFGRHRAPENKKLKAPGRPGPTVNFVKFFANRKKMRTLAWQVRRVRESGMFDETWYVQRYPDVAAAGHDPIAHYLQFGAKEMRNPSPRFDTSWYLNHYPDVAKEGMNPLLHYIKFGQKEGRQTMRTIA